MTTRRTFLRGLGAAGLVGVAPLAFSEVVCRAAAQPQEVPWTLKPVIQVAAGYHHTIALRDDGTAVLAGLYKDEHTEILAATDLTSVVADAYGSIAVRSDGTVVTSDYFSKFDTSDWHGISSVDVSNGHLVGLRNDGKIVSTDGSFGVGDSNGVTGIKAIAAGDFATYGVHLNGTVSSWGLTPDVSGWSNIKNIVASGYLVIGLRADGTVEADYRASPPAWLNEVRTWTDIADIAVADYVGPYVVGIKNNGTVVAVGENGYGQLGNGRNDDQTTTITVPAWGSVKAVAAGGEHTVAIRSDGSVVSAGSNTHGKLGDGSNIRRSTPVESVQLMGMLG